ncbi:MAG: hypothetical protein EZS28_050155, partial [Streblomastix strix]
FGFNLLDDQFEIQKEESNKKFPTLILACIFRSFDAKDVEVVLNNAIVTIKSSDLLERYYETQFKYFKNLELMPCRHIVVSGDYFKRDSVTSIIHYILFFRGDDYSVCISGGVMTGKEGLIACSVDNNGCFTREVDDYAGRCVKKCDKDIIKSII